MRFADGTFEGLRARLDGEALEDGQIPPAHSWWTHSTAWEWRWIGCCRRQGCHGTSCSHELWGWGFGVLGPLLASSLHKNTRPQFAAMNKALAERV